MKAVRYLAYAVVGLVVLVAIALGAAVAIVDGKFVMGKAERWLKEEKQRTLKVEGEPKLSLFPVLRLALGKTTLSEPKSDKLFISLDSMEVAVKVMPLLARELSMEVFSVAGFKANIVKEKDGRFNFEDLAGKRDEEEPADQPPKVRIAAITIENAQLTFTDEIGGRSLAVSDVSMKAGGLADDQPGPLSISATVRGKKPEVALKVLVGGTAMINLARQAFALAKLDARVTGSADTLKGLDLRVTGDLAADRRSQVYTVDTLNLQAKGMLERDVLAVALSAPKLRITSSKAEGQAVSGTLSLKGPQRNVDAKLSMAAVEGSASALTVPSLVLDFDGKVSGSTLKGQVSSPVKANLKEGVWELAKVAANLTLSRADTAFKAKLAGAATMNPAKQMLAIAGLDASASGSHETLKGLQLHVTGNLAADARKHEYTADKVALQASGTLDKDAFTGSFQAPKLRITPSKAEGQAITGAVTVKGPQRDINAKLVVAAVEGSGRALSIPSIALELVSMVAGNGVKGSVTTPVNANLTARSVELPKVVANLTFSGPAIPQKTVTLPISGSFRADYTRQSGQADFVTRFDETNINAKVAATKLEPLVGTFDVNIDKLNLDRYLPPDSKGSDAPIDLSPLRGKTLTGKFAAGALQVKRVKLQNVKADIKLANGRLEVSPHSAGLYGGTLAGALSADASGNRFGIKETIQGVNIGALLKDVVQKDTLDGKGNITMDLQTAGTTVPALKRGLAGTAKVEIKDGAVWGINLADTFRNATTGALGMLGVMSKKTDRSQKTNFTVLSASFNIRNGVARNDDMKVVTPIGDIAGAGNLDIGANGIDYLAKASVPVGVLAKAAVGATSTAQGGSNLTIPVKLTGALDNPNWSLDFSSALASMGKGVGGALGKAGSAIGGIFGGKSSGDAKSAPPAGKTEQKSSSPTDKIRGLFGR